MDCLQNIFWYLDFHIDIFQMFCVLAARLCVRSLRDKYKIREDTWLY